MELDDKPESLGSSIELSMVQRFELEKMIRAIDNCSSLDEMKSLAKQLVSSWMTQKAAIAWMIRNQADSSRSFGNR